MLPHLFFCKKKSGGAIGYRMATCVREHYSRRPRLRTFRWIPLQCQLKHLQFEWGRASVGGENQSDPLLGWNSGGYSWLFGSPPPPPQGARRNSRNCSVITGAGRRKKGATLEPSLLRTGLFISNLLIVQNIAMPICT